MKKYIKFLTIFFFYFTLSTSAQAKEKIKLVLDWFVNPDHAAIIIAQQQGFFAQQDLDVEIIEPADPTMPAKLVAAGQADLAVDYQPQLHLQVDQGLPVMRVGALVDSPLNTVIVLDNGSIKSIADLKGKKIGFSVSGFEEVLLSAMLKSAQLSLKDVELVNVNWSLSPALLSKQVDAIIGGFRNFELNQIHLEQHKGNAFLPEQYNVPMYDELILVAHNKQYDKQKISRFLTALEQATDYLQKNPEKSWSSFVNYKPKDLDTELNRLAWRDTLPLLSQSPRTLDIQRYHTMANFMYSQGLIKTVPAVSHYAQQIDEGN